MTVDHRISLSQLFQWCVCIIVFWQMRHVKMCFTTTYDKLPLKEMALCWFQIVMSSYCSQSQIRILCNSREKLHLIDETNNIVLYSTVWTVPCALVDLHTCFKFPVFHKHDISALYTYNEKPFDLLSTIQSSLSSQNS